MNSATGSKSLSPSRPRKGPTRRTDEGIGAQHFKGTKGEWDGKA
jgi:hypothetical protein